MIKGINFASIPVRDQARALEFYTTKLGYRLIPDVPMEPDQRWIDVGFPRADAKLVLFTAPGQEAMIGGHMNVSLLADDVSATAAELAERGVEFVKPATKEPWGTSAIFRDLDGNRFVLSTP